LLVLINRICYNGKAQFNRSIKATFQNILFEENFTQWLFQNFTRVSDRFLVFHSKVPKLERKSSYFLHRVKFSAFCASELRVNCADWRKKRLTSSKPSNLCDPRNRISLFNELQSFGHYLILIVTFFYNNRRITTKKRYQTKYFIASLYNNRLLLFTVLLLAIPPFWIRSNTFQKITLARFEHFTLDYLSSNNSFEM